MEYDRDSWIAAYSTPTGPVEPVYERPWSTVLRAPVEGGAVWFKACGSVQAWLAVLPRYAELQIQEAPTMHNEADRVPFARLRDAYLEPWGGDVQTFELALRVGWGAYAIAWLRQYEHLRSDEERAEFMREFANVLREAYSAAA